ncbi:hypothetical protein [Aquabacterium sp.]|uniref:hypothetical protein n=1 Tax=Aquabacterium sp. TaxID=1872578 RepID=UPI0025BA7013|nr:hypothetical protein [Aquabacterium sp.]
MRREPDFWPEPQDPGRRLRAGTPGDRDEKVKRRRKQVRARRMAILIEKRRRS